MDETPRPGPARPRTFARRARTTVDTLVTVGGIGLIIVFLVFFRDIR